MPFGHSCRRNRVNSDMCLEQAIGRHSPGMLEHVGRLVEFGMKLGAQSERLRSWSTRSYDYADPRPSPGNMTGQI